MSATIPDLVRNADGGWSLNWATEAWERPGGGRWYAVATWPRGPSVVVAQLATGGATCEEALSKVRAFVALTMARTMGQA